MSRIPVLGALVAAVALVLAMLTPGAAHAATGTTKDPARDAAKTIDIVSLKVNNGQTTIKGTMKIKDLGSKGAFSVTWSAPDFSSSYGVALQKKRGKTRVTFVKVDIVEGTRKVMKCKGLKGTWNTKKNFVAFTAPQRCNGSVPSSWMFSGAAALSKSKYDVTDAPISLARG